MLPRIPLVDDVKDPKVFSKAERKLADLHLNYENQGKYAGVHETHSGNVSYRVMKMKYGKALTPTLSKGEGESGRLSKGVGDKVDKTKIIYNEFTTIGNIPQQAYDYIVNGKSAIDWIMERYQITTHKESGITNDPNDWCEETGNPRYIIDLLHSVINLSVQTVEIVKNLPKVKFEQ